MKFTGMKRQSQMVEGVCVPDGDYDELLREALRIALGIIDPCSGDFEERHARIHQLMCAYIRCDCEEGEEIDAPTLMARLAVNISAVIPLAERKAILEGKP